MKEIFGILSVRMGDSAPKAPPITEEIDRQPSFEFFIATKICMK